MGDGSVRAACRGGAAAKVWLRWPVIDATRTLHASYGDHGDRGERRRGAQRCPSGVRRSLSTLGPCRVLVVGDLADPHVQVVTKELPPEGLVVVDAESLPRTAGRIGLDESVLHDATGKPVVLSLAVPIRGWVRRLAPAGWDGGVVLGSHRAAVLASRLALLGAVLRDPAVTWLTPVDALVAAENKLVQYRAAIRLGVRVPATVVAHDAGALAAELGDPFLLKPLGPGNFADDTGGQQVTYARVVSPQHVAGVDLTDAPFLAQQAMIATRHLRVVTVLDHAWSAELDATGLPHDWRRHGPAHHAFKYSDQPSKLSAAAIELADGLGVGYSSQDWLVDNDGPVFLDLNPGGQWLFLPEATAQPVTQALASWLLDGPRT